MNTGQHGRKDRLIKEQRHDVYERQGKWPEATRCTKCNAIYSNGRWLWKEGVQGAHEAVCPACKRIADRYPAGYVDISGPFFKEKREEILSLIRNVEKQEKDERPLERIIEMTEEGESFLITTTGVHIARRIGEALSRACKGNLSLKYGDGEESVRVSWSR